MYVDAPGTVDTLDSRDTLESLETLETLGSLDSSDDAIVLVRSFRIDWISRCRKLRFSCF